MHNAKISALCASLFQVQQVAGSLDPRVSFSLPLFLRPFAIVGFFYVLTLVGHGFFAKSLKKQHINFWHRLCLLCSRNAPSFSEGFMGKLVSKFRVGAFAGALGVAVMASTSASAGPITVAGITFGSGANLKSTTIFGNIVTAPGQTLTRIGRVNTIDAASCRGPCLVSGHNR